MKRCAVLLAALAACVGGCGGSVDPSKAEEARELVLEARARMAESESAFARADQTTWSAAYDESKALYREAARAYRAAGYDISRDVSFLQEYAEALSEAGDADLAAETYGRCIALQPENAEWYLRRGVALAAVTAQPSELAVADLLRAVELDPEGALAEQARAELAEIYWGARQYELARQECVALSSEGVPGINCTAILAATDVRSGNVVAAYERINAIQQLTPEDQATLSERVGEGIDGFRLRKLSFEDNAQNHSAFAQLALLAGRGQDAVLAASRAAQRAPENTGVLNLAASLEAQTGNIEAALTLFQQSLALDESQSGVRDAIAQLEAARTQQ